LAKWRPTRHPPSSGISTKPNLIGFSSQRPGRAANCLAPIDPARSRPDCQEATFFCRNTICQLPPPRLLHSLLDDRQDVLDCRKELGFDCGEILGRPIPVHNKAKRYWNLPVAIVHNRLPSKSLGVERKAGKRRKFSPLCVRGRVRRYCRRNLYGLGSEALELSQRFRLGEDRSLKGLLVTRKRNRARCWPALSRH
jgi:hypothetical protein